jgi:hypothetical protein
MTTRTGCGVDTLSVGPTGRALAALTCERHNRIGAYMP